LQEFAETAGWRRRRSLVAGCLSTRRFLSTLRLG
jgi:hypothetical protein